MRQLFLVMAFVLFLLGSAFAATEQYDTHLYVYDASTGGNVTANTRQVLLFVGIKGTDTTLSGFGDQSVSTTISVPYPTGIETLDFQGTHYNLVPVNSSNSPITFVPKGSGETVLNFGKYNLSTGPNGIKPVQGLIINILDWVPYYSSYGDAPATYLRASTVINFNEPASSSALTINAS